MQTCDIVIPVWNQCAITRECIGSIIKHTDSPYRLIVIDNGSEEETAGYLKSLKGEPHLDILIIRNDINLGFVKAVNQGIVASSAPYVCIMNNDTVVTAGWLDELLGVMASDRGLGIVNPSSNTSGQSPAPGQSIDAYAASLAPRKGEVQEVNLCRGFCMLVRREVIRSVGLLDETFGIGYFEETDFCKRAIKSGFTLCRAKAAYVYHKEGISFREHGSKDALFKQNERTYFNRWGRLVRAAYLAPGDANSGKIDDISLAVARRGHQMLVFVKKGGPWPVTKDHFDVRKVEVGPAAFRFCALLALVRRRKKKAVELVLTDDRSLGSLFKATKFLHGADVMVEPDREAVLAFLEARSKVF